MIQAWSIMWGWWSGFCVWNERTLISSQIKEKQSITNILAKSCIKMVMRLWFQKGQSTHFWLRGIHCQRKDQIYNLYCGVCMLHSLDWPKSAQVLCFRSLTSQHYGIIHKVYGVSFITVVIIGVPYWVSISYSFVQTITYLRQLYFHTYLHLFILLFMSWRFWKVRKWWPRIELLQTLTMA